MNICMVSRDFLPSVGGIAAHVYELSKSLVKQGHTVHVVQTGYGSPGTEHSEIDGIEVHRPTFARGLKYVRRLRLLAGTRRFLHRLIDDESIDIIHWHELNNSSLETKVLRTDLPMIFTNHSSHYLATVEKRSGRAYLRWLLRHADYVICPSEELHEKTGLVGVPAERRCFIPNGVDAQRFSPETNGDAVRERYGVPPESVLVVCARRLEPKNGVIYLARAIQHVRRALGPGAVKFVITGREFSQGPAVAAQIEEDGVGDDVILTESIPNTEMPAYYAASDIVVLPSLMEAVSITALEAMSTGKPVVSTDVGGLPYIVKEGETGRLAPPRDPEALAAALIKVAEDPDGRKKMGANARKMIEERFAWEIIAKRTAEVYGRFIPGA